MAAERIPKPLNEWDVVEQNPKPLMEVRLNCAWPGLVLLYVY